ncbi:Mitochondrial distribution and morphology protein 12 [Botryosphaeria dothidea]
MPTSHFQDAPSPSTSTLRLSLGPLGRTSRRGSIASLSSRGPVDKEVLREALDQIHTSASRSETLTTFDQFASPPPPSIHESKGITGDLVQGGLSGLYNRFKSSVSRGRESVPAPLSPTVGYESDGSIASSKANGKHKGSKSVAGTTVSSPILLSSPPSHVQSPLVNTFKEAGLPPPVSSENSSTSRASASTPQSPLPLPAKSKPLLSLTPIEHAMGKTHNSSRSGSISEHHVRRASQSTTSSQLERVAPPRSIPRSQPDQPPDKSRPSIASRMSEDDDSSVFGEDDMVLVDELPLNDAGSFFAPRSELSQGQPGPIVHSAPLTRKNSQTTQANFARESKEALSRQSNAGDAPSEAAVKTSKPDTPTSAASGATRPPMVQIGPSHLPGYRPSRASSSDGMSSLTTVAPTQPRHASLQQPDDHHRSVSQTRQPDMRSSNSTLAQMKRRVLGKEFWMRDENAKDCFYCGEVFSTFRRKHHCRTCGQIFDAKCTSLVSGKVFGQSGNIRVCKPCEAIINGNEDDSSDYSEDADQSSLFESEALSRPLDRRGSIGTDASKGDAAKGAPGSQNIKARDHTKIGTPMMGIPTSRKPGEKRLRSAVIEFNAGQSALPRPSSSRSLRSLSMRPLSSSGHRRHHSRHQHMRSLKDDRAPFHRHQTEELDKRSSLPAFHNDSIIDPDLAAFMSDEDSSEDEQPSIFATLSSESQDTNEGDRNGLGGLLSVIKKGKSRTGDRSIAAQLAAPMRDFDTTSISSRHMPRHNRRRNLSVSSVTHRPSPRRTKSNSLLKPFGINLASIVGGQSGTMSTLAQVSGGGSKMVRSASMRGEHAPAVELNRASLQHVRKLLRQMLQDANVATASSWEKALMPILLRCTDDVNPDVQRSDDIDVRHYIKLKKIPGGRPGDTSYISGVVFTKNVALKSMPRSIPQPRVLIVTFPIEYARHQQHFMSLEPVIAQEREFLRNLVGRIAALNPQVLFVQRNVSGLALQYLEEANITVVHNVKPSVLNAVSRCLQIRMISSIDKLATDPSTLGQCQSFDVKTYVHGRVKKTYIYLSGCKKELGCTIVLRGADTTTLRKLKQITEFLCYVVYNLKLETCLMRDEFVLIPSSMEELDPRPGKQSNELAAHGGEIVKPAALPESKSTAEQNPTIQVQDESGEHIQADNGSSIDISDRLSDVQQQLQQQEQPLDQTQEQANALKTSGSQELAIPADVPMPSFYGDMVEKHRTKILSASPFIKFMQPYLLTQAREQERRLAYLRRLLDQYGQIQDEEEEQDSHENFELVQPEMVHTVVQRASRQVRDFLHAVHDAEYDKAMHNYLTQKRQWEAYLSANSDLFDPFTHQKIAVLYSVVNSVTSTPCIGPEIISLEFYKEHDLDPGFAADCTLGQYVEDLCYTAGQICTANGCGKKMLEHHRHYIHGEGQMSVVVERYPSKIRGLHNTMLMWSSCRICGQETQTIPMSDSTWKYSFAKYLELTFWSTNLHPRADVCPHDIHRNHVRYFGFNNYALRIQFDPIELYEVIVPRPTITWKVDRDLKLKNEQFLKIEDRLDKFMASVKARIKSIRVDSVIPEKQEACKAEIANLMKRANEEQDFLRRKLQDKYMCSRYYEIIPLNRAIRAIHEKALAWDETFAKFEKAFFPSEKDIQRLAVLQLKKIFLDRDESQTSVNSIEEGIEEAPAVLDGGQTSEKDAEKITSPTPTGMSPEQTRDMLASVVEQDQNEKDAEKAEEGQETPHAVQEPEQPADSGTKPAQPAPTIDQSDAVEREEVRHLDLAVPADSPSSPKAQSPQSSQELQVPGMDLSRTSTNTGSTVPHPAPLSRAVSDLVEQMRSGGDHYASEAPQESRIPRLVDMSKREPGSTLISRAQSSTGIARMQQGPSNASSATVATSSTAKTESSKPSLTESARALEERMSKRLGLGSLRANKSGHSMIPRSVPSKPNNPKVSTLAKHFEQLSKEFERQRLRERHQRAAKSRQARAYPLASSKPIVEIYRDAADAVQEKESDEDVTGSTPPPRLSADTSTLNDSNYTATTTPTIESQSPVDRHHEEPAESSKRIDGGESVADTASLHHHSDAEGEVSDVEHILEDIGIPDISDESQILPPMDSSMDLSVDLPKHEKSFMMKMLNNFWSERSASGWMPLDYPFAPIEHVWEDSDIIVREDEPSSIIALALSNADYQSKLQEFRSEVGEGGDAGSESTANSEEANIEHNLRHKSNTNIKYVFQNRSVRATCKIFFAQSFDAMRRKCGVADRFEESMSRCLKWDSKGGKTKSLFLKTLDDRFVLKSLSQVEVNAFLKFAPDYFSFIHQNLFNNLPSVIAKMFGLFQVTIKNPASGRDFDCFMLVMENLFYDRGNDLRRFDLKGSMRNRKIQSTGEQDEVLLDENLVDIIFEKPIFVREHTKKTLTLSVYNDTLFLSKQNVMDYSLMAGFNDSNREIVVGIIDCIRTYTWDKKLETWIKDRGKNKPTVTSPKDYRQRFRVAMSSYILQAPDFWHAFNTAVPSGGAAPTFHQHQQQQQIEASPANGDVGGEMLQGQDGALMGDVDRRLPEVPLEAEVEMGLGGMMAEGARGG